MSIDDIVNTVKDVMKKNREILISNGTNGSYQVTGIVNDIEYVVGFKNGRIGQFYIKK